LKPWYLLAEGYPIHKYEGCILQEAPFKTAPFWLVKSTNGYGYRNDWIAGQNQQTIAAYFTNPDVRTELIEFSNIRLIEIKEADCGGKHVTFTFKRDIDPENYSFDVEPGNFGYPFLYEYYADYINEFFEEIARYWHS